MLNNFDLASYIDHTLLKQDAKKKDVFRLCREAKKFGFKAVCVNPCYVAAAKKALAGSKVLICSVCGFPLGASDAKTKTFEAKHALKDGADEIDVVMNLGFFKSGDYSAVSKELKTLRKACGKKTLKVIIETSLLSASEIKKAAKIAVSAGADFVKTSTGFGTRGATVNDIKLIRSAVPNAKIKASGGIKSYKQAAGLIKAGAERIGSSSSVKIVSPD
jgi:deoxyribose-phosphate aldolase